MPRKNAKAQKSNELDGAEFFTAIGLIEQEKAWIRCKRADYLQSALSPVWKRAGFYIRQVFHVEY